MPFHIKTINNLFKGKLVPLLVFLFVCVLFGLLTIEQRNNLDPNIKIAKLIANSQIVQIANWRVSFEHCAEPTYRYCESVGESFYDIDFPDPKKLTQIISEITKETGQRPNKAFMETTLDFSTKAWFQSQIAVNLVMPSFASNQIRLLEPAMSQFVYADPNNHVIGVPKSIISSDTIKLETYFIGMNWFGSDSTPPALARSQATRAYATIDELQKTTSHLNRLLEITIPLLIAAMALIIDHSAGVFLLALFSTTFATRIVITMFSEFFPDNQYLEYLLFVFFGLSPVFLVKYCLFLIGKNLSLKITIALSFLSSLACVLFLHFDKSSQIILSIDLWVDGLAALISLVIISYGMIQLKRHPDRLQAQFISTNSRNKMLVLLFAALFLSLSAYANIDDLINYYQGNNKDFLNWAHQALIPGLLMCTFLDVGSVVNTIKRVSSVVREKSRMDRDIEIGKQLQSGILPDKKYRSDGFEWHAFYYPAAHLAGDWFDLRDLEFKDGQRVLLACIVDVTGHGISSAMMTANIASHWSIWYEEVMKLDYPDTDEALKALISTAPVQVHRGLIGLRYNLGCSMAVVMYHPKTKKLVYLTAGHPGVILGTSDSFDYLITKGSRPGIKSETVAWESATKTLSPDVENIILYTDGIVEQEKSVPVWLKHVKRNALKSKKSSLYYFLSQLRTNKKFYKKTPEKEDDLTLLVIKIKKDQTIT